MDGALGQGLSGAWSSHDQESGPQPLGTRSREVIDVAVENKRDCRKISISHVCYFKRGKYVTYRKAFDSQNVGSGVKSKSCKVVGTF